MVGLKCEVCPFCAGSQPVATATHVARPRADAPTPTRWGQAGRLDDAEASCAICTFLQPTHHSAIGGHQAGARTILAVLATLWGEVWTSECVCIPSCRPWT